MKIFQVWNIYVFLYPSFSVFSTLLCRIGSTINPPFVTKAIHGCTRRECFRGIFADFFHELRTVMNFTFTLTVPEGSTKISKLSNDKWIPLIGVVYTYRILIENSSSVILALLCRHVGQTWNWHCSFGRFDSSFGIVRPFLTSHSSRASQIFRQELAVRSGLDDLHATIEIRSLDLDPRTHSRHASLSDLRDVVR